MNYTQEQINNANAFTESLYSDFNPGNGIRKRRFEYLQARARLKKYRMSRSSDVGLFVGHRRFGSYPTSPNNSSGIGFKTWSDALASSLAEYSA